LNIFIHFTHAMTPERAIPLIAILSNPSVKVSGKNQKIGNGRDSLTEKLVELILILGTRLSARAYSDNTVKNLQRMRTRMDTRRRERFLCCSIHENKRLPTASRLHASFCRPQDGCSRKGAALFTNGSTTSESCFVEGCNVDVQ